MFNVLMKSCIEEGEAEKACNVMEDLRDSGLLPTNDSYEILMDVLSRRADRLKECFDVYNRMLAEDMPATTSVYTHLLRACAVSGHIRLCKNVIRAMGESEPAIPVETHMYPLIVTVYANAMRLPSTTDELRLKYIK
eukprot:GHVN01058217.1.p1 GENE.GHVN01058217.1~~GHVN01058217.1.p1  ORF type:complete len:137 (+),score=29.01 GHVN01058217.1:192-602(+)